MMEGASLVLFRSVLGKTLLCCHGRLFCGSDRHVRGFCGQVLLDPMGKVTISTHIVVSVNWPPPGWEGNVKGAHLFGLVKRSKHFLTALKLNIFLMFCMGSVLIVKMLHHLNTCSQLRSRPYSVSWQVVWLGQPSHRRWCRPMLEIGQCNNLLSSGIMSIKENHDALKRLTASFKPDCWILGRTWRRQLETLACALQLLVRNRRRSLWGKYLQDIWRHR